MDNVFQNVNAAHAFYFIALILEPSTGSNLSTCPLHVVNVVFLCYFGHEIESSFKVWGCESTFSGLNKHVSIGEGIFFLYLT